MQLMHMILSLLVLFMILSLFIKAIPSIIKLIIIFAAIGLLAGLLIDMGALMRGV